MQNRWIIITTLIVLLVLTVATALENFKPSWGDAGIPVEWYSKM